jgi:hypothetical protein
LKAAGVYEALFRVAAADFPAETRENELVEIGDLVTSVEHLSPMRLAMTGGGAQEVLPPIRIEGAVPTDLAGWVGRHHELQALDAWWDSADGSAWIVGMGGTGKSGILQTWLAALRDIGYEKPARVHVRYVRARETKQSDIDKIMAWLKREATDVKLIVIDGFDESDARDPLELLLQEGAFVGARMLVSSRLSPSARVGPMTTVIDLGEMSQDECVQYLGRLGLARSDATALARAIQYHPLAAGIAANLVLKHSYSIPDLLVDLSRNSEEHAEPIKSAVRLGISRLSLQARTALEQMCADDPAGAKMDLDGAIDPLRVSINELVEAGLIQVLIGKSSMSTAVHPLVRQIVRHA